ncbi:hypothetical protein ES332_A06G072200v1 [Gossypium tomentosum]|uniref:Uncharacterized protein n=1 Tax=Gossypium tomentosum TaxID=34277 RepID=A0A5D2Q0H8_GOSTO|nr:hypothetical protein ES332_A06G072200v1 [Gossypium tomentosum]
MAPFSKPDIKTPFSIYLPFKTLIIFKPFFFKKKRKNPLTCSVRVSSACSRQTTIHSMVDGVNNGQISPTEAVTTVIWYGACVGT